MDEVIKLYEWMEHARQVITSERLSIKELYLSTVDKRDRDKYNYEPRVLAFKGSLGIEIN